MNERKQAEERAHQLIKEMGLEIDRLLLFAHDLHADGGEFMDAYTVLEKNSYAAENLREYLMLSTKYYTSDKRAEIRRELLRELKAAQKQVTRIKSITSKHFFILTEKPEAYVENETKVKIISALVEQAIDTIISVGVIWDPRDEVLAINKLEDDQIKLKRAKKQFGTSGHINRRRSRDMHGAKL